MDEVNQSGSVEFIDTAQFSEAIQPWQVQLDQLQARPWRARFEFVQIPGLVIYREHWRSRIHVTGATPADYVMFGFPASRKTELLWSGSQLGVGAATIEGQSTEVDFFTADTSDHVVMLVYPALLTRHLGEEMACSLSRRTRNIGGLYPQSCARIVQTIDGLIDRYLADGALLDDVREHIAIEHELMAMLDQAIVHPPGNFRRKQKLRRSRAMQQAIEYFRSESGPVRVPEMCSAIGVSQRSLEYAFKESLGLSPNAYFRFSRINKLYRALLAAKPGSQTVTAEAAKLGFSEMGRLAGQYQRLFGELPSTTLARRPSPPPLSLMG